MVALIILHANVVVLYGGHDDAHINALDLYDGDLNNMIFAHQRL
jgi:hypothetical protein